MVGACAFLTPTLTHFGGVLLLSLAALAPFASPWPTAVVFCLCGLGGLAYLTKVVAARRKVDFVALTWPTGFPTEAFRRWAMRASSSAQPDWAPGSFAPSVIAGATTLFLFCGIYGAWDLTLWIVVRGHKP
jgi:hypothetical protein